jgi:hypothetical protein
VNNSGAKIFGSNLPLPIFATRFTKEFFQRDCEAGSSLQKNFDGKNTRRIFAVRSEKRATVGEKKIWMNKQRILPLQPTSKK